MTLSSQNKMNASVGSLSPHNHHRKFRNPISCYRRRRYKPPGTPLLSWKFDERQRAYGYGYGYGDVEVSARKLAAGLWQLRLLAEASDCGVKCRSCDQFRFQHESSLPFANSLMEGVTKWDPGCSKTSTDTYYLYNYNQVKILEDQVTTFSVVSALQAELVQARLRIHELEDEHQSSKKKFENLMRKLREDLEERNLRYIRKRHKMQAIIDDLKDELIREKKSRKQIGLIKSKFAEEVAKAESSAKQFMQDYEEEKRARELLEEVCNELAKKIGGDKTKLEMLKGEAIRIREEVEEERNMLQLAEIWREERVQMKLVDAKLALEDKYSQMNKLVGELESFLSSSAATLDVMALRKAELIRQAVESVNIQDSEEFEYVPPESGSLFSVFEELRQGADEREVEVVPLTNYSPICDASNYHITSPEVNDFDNNHVLKLLNGFISCKNGFEKDPGAWECVRHAENQGSRCFIEGSNLWINSVSGGKIDSKSIIMYSGNVGQHSPNTDTSDVCSISGEQLIRQKASSVSQLRSEGGGTIANVGTTRKLINGGRSLRDSTWKFTSRDLGNPHIRRGMKGSIEWPRVTLKTKLKGKLLKTMMKKPENSFA